MNDDISAAAAELASEIAVLLQRQAAMEEDSGTSLASIDSSARASAQNLLHYLALRQVDLRPLQKRLIVLGLTSLGGMEASSRCSLQAVERALCALAGFPAPQQSPPPVDFVSGRLQLHTNASRLLGSPANNRAVRVMVTMPSEAADDYQLVLGLLQSGMCEAAHVPVIWATQILETLAKTGSPSRAEVTDAVASGNAECAMLNKGPYIQEAVQFLCGVLERVETNHLKKHNLLRKLSIADLKPPGS